VSGRPDETESIRRFLAGFPDGLKAARQLVAEDAVWRHWRWRGLTLVGRSAILERYFDRLDEAYGDYSFEVCDAIVDRDRVAVRGRFRGTFRRSFHGVRATGAPVSWLAHDIYRFERGLIVEAWFANDTYTVAREMGVIAPDEPWPWCLPGS